MQLSESVTDNRLNAMNGISIKTFQKGITLFNFLGASVCNCNTLCTRYLMHVHLGMLCIIY